MTTFRIEALVLVVTSVIANCPCGNAKVSCKNAKNKDVDWFVVYKIPKTKPDSRSFMRPLGGEMAYYDSQSKTPRWTLLPDDINNKTNNPIKNTLAPIYEKQSKIAYLAYNDQLPHKFNGTRGGHTKGVLLAGTKMDLGSVWLQHSVPRFVEDVSKGYMYPKNGRENGQLFFCITFPLPTVEKIYIYTEELSGHVQDSITVQTWKNGAGGAQDMHCKGQYKITDVVDVAVRTQNGALYFSSREDHSKWSVARHKAVFCFSSLNRMVSQWRRGGEITCIYDMPLAKLFRESISKRNVCKGETAQ
ncbi:deoxyribonuclease-2-beta isoform X2 [Rhipicephalus sanguineus]|uniref:deoxyribonuclease-2-beta isoform X2 n=1 Tax=Rhipicephalus sanguineus TaxID=34632 RepID=UPI00189558FE|nr:deoxyribonuclease-2-beta isoform X2 [Rhipicephalus sanguineus]